MTPLKKTLAVPRVMISVGTVSWSRENVEESAQERAEAGGDRKGDDRAFHPLSTSIFRGHARLGEASARKDTSIAAGDGDEVRGDGRGTTIATARSTRLFAVAPGRLDDQASCGDRRPEARVGVESS